MKGKPQVLNLSDKGSYSIGPYRIPTTLGDATKAGSHSSSTIHRNKHKEAVKMRRQKNMAQMKEQNKTLEKELNKLETSNLLDARFKTLVIRMPSEFKERIDKISENFNSIN